MKTVVQKISKTTSVKLNWYNGKIQTVVLSDNADTEFEFIILNKKARPGSQIMLSTLYSGEGVAQVTLVSQEKGSFVVRVSNVGVVAFSKLVEIGFRIYYS
jgi:hypothetical protein